MKRLIVVYNPRSSQFGRVREEVLDAARGLRGWAVGKFEVRDTDVDDNAGRLRKLIEAGDLVVSAGGDGTATIALNGVVLAGKEGVMLGVLPYGNFNDMARSFGVRSFAEMMELVERGSTREAWVLECLVNGKRWRYGLGYFTIGLFAEACKVFDQKENRRRLRTGRKGLVYSAMLLFRWYLKHRKRKFMGDFTLKRGEQRWRCEGVTDYVAMNGRYMAKVMRGQGSFLRRRGFGSEAKNLRGFFSLAWLMMRSILRRVPGVETEGDELTFDSPSEMMIQAEGEYERFSGVERIEVRKVERAIKVVVKG